MSNILKRAAVDEKHRETGRILRNAALYRPNHGHFGYRHIPLHRTDKAAAVRRVRAIGTRADTS
jgi:hypothetical protein